MTQSRIIRVLSAIGLSSVLLIALLKKDDVARYFAGLRAEVETNASEVEVEIRMDYYEKLEQKRTRDPAHWTDKDESELRLLEQIVRSTK